MHHDELDVDRNRPVAPRLDPQRAPSSSHGRGLRLDAREGRAILRQVLQSSEAGQRRLVTRRGCKAALMVSDPLHFLLDLLLPPV